MRRSEREITDGKELLQLLQKGSVLHLGLSDGGRPYVVPLSYGWLEEEGGISLYFHCALEGRKLDIIRKNSRCAGVITGDAGIVRGAQACSWSASYASLMLEGEVEILEDEAQRKRGLDALMRHYGWEGEAPYSEAALKKALVCRVRVRSLTGKRSPHV